MGMTLAEEGVYFAENNIGENVVDHYNAHAAFCEAIGVNSATTQHLDAVAQVVGFNARESTDAVLAAFDRAERIIQIARAMYAEKPSHAAPEEVPDAEVEMCVMQAIGRAASR